MPAFLKSALETSSRIRSLGAFSRVYPVNLLGGGDVFLSLFEECIESFDFFYAYSFGKVTSSTEPSVEQIEFHA
ncbi:hypothetical protein A2U01_0060190, partial [Trifolium medium]|nr:hypothetical protein [Trifolium medium]